MIEIMNAAMEMTLEGSLKKPADRSLLDALTFSPQASSVAAEWAMNREWA
jgi:hypothetical protein